jgi:hypothetical protein
MNVWVSVRFSSQKHSLNHPKDESPSTIFYLLIPQKAEKSLSHKFSTLIGHFKARNAVISPGTHEGFFPSPIVGLRTAASSSTSSTTLHGSYLCHGLGDFIFGRRSCSSLIVERLVSCLDRTIVHIVTWWTSNIGHGARC